jgi:hypothetical protein
MRISTVTAFSLVLVLAAACSDTTEQDSDSSEPVARIDGRSITRANLAREPASPKHADWSDYLFVQMRIVHPLQLRLIEAEGIRVTTEDFAAAGIEADPGMSPERQEAMIDPMLHGALSGLEIKIKQGRSSDHQRLQALKKVADNPNATLREKVDVLGPEAQAMLGGAARWQAESRLLAWKADQLLYERHGGRVVRRTAPDDPESSYTIPIDAYKAWLSDLEDRDIWDLYSGFEDRFWSLFEVLPIDETVEDEAAYYASPPDLSQVSDAP